MARIPGITIVIPVHNRARIVGSTLKSVREQTLRPLRVILVDNGSTDDTHDVLEQWRCETEGDLDVSIITETVPGAAAARNAGLARVETEWTMFFDSDDTMAPEHCRRALRAADGVDVVGWDVRYYDGKHKTVLPFYTTDAQYHNLFHGSMSTQRYMARTELFRNAGGWNASVLYWNDIELGARILQQNPRIKKIQGTPTVTMFHSDESITGTSYSSRTERAAHALECIAGTLGPERRRWVDVKHIIFAADCAREGSQEGGKIYKEIIANNTSAGIRLLLRAVYLYRRAGGRGVARLIRILL